MALRLLEIVVPCAQIVEAETVLNGNDPPPLRVWRATDSSDSSCTVLKALLDASETEPILDSLQRRFGKFEDFHMVLLPVEAALPRPPPSEARQPGGKARRRERRVSREELYSDLAESMDVTADFLAMAALSTVLAAIGMMRSSPAIVIGAMVVAPLLRPNVSLALASTLGDKELARAALKLNGVGVLLALGLSFVGGVLFTVDPALSEIASRASAGFPEIVLAIAAGAAGALAYTGGLSSALTGVMVAVALLPPAVTTGLLLGSGHYALSLGALSLLVTNVICVNLAGVIVFLAKGVKPRTFWEAEKARRATRRAIVTWSVLLSLLILILLAVSGH